MKHLGDITKISGYTAPIVDCIIGGSPCQDLSVAGKRAGLDGERSGLYIEQVRIVKEMRERDERNGRTGVDVRPRYMVWENVCGALSSGKPRGADLRVVLEELARVVDEGISIPRPPKDKWSNTGVIIGDGYSIAWRVLDAQHWGVPQRRRRIALVADFGGHNAPRILFDEREHHGRTERVHIEPSVGGTGGQPRPEVQAVSQGLPRNSDESQPQRQEAPDHATGGFGADDRLGADQYLFQPVYSVENHPADSRVDIDESGKVQTLTSRMGTGGGNVPMVMQQCFSKSKRAQSVSDNETCVESETANTLNAFDVGDVRTTEAVVLALDRASYQDKVGALCARDYKGVCSQYVDEDKLVCYTIDQGGGKSSVDVREDKAPTLTTTHDGAPAMAYSFYPQMKAESQCWTEEVANCIVNGTNPGYQNGVVCANKSSYIVRRLTPLECERLQGYPDGWTDIGEWTDSNGKKRQTSDAARYKALGNSIALPPWKWVLKRLCACYERDATMASLFDGIGGFPFLWEQLNGKGSCLWASEIEEFPIAVTKVRIGGGT